MAGKRRTERTEGQARADFVRICCYVALVLAAVLIFIDNLLPLLEIDVGGAFFDVLRLIKDVALLLGIVFGAYAFARAHETFASLVSFSPARASGSSAMRET